MSFSKSTLLTFLLSQVPLAKRLVDLAEELQASATFAEKAEVVKRIIDEVVPYGELLSGMRSAHDSEESAIVLQEQLLDALAGVDGQRGVAAVPRRDGRVIAAVLAALQTFLPLILKK